MNEIRTAADRSFRIDILIGGLILAFTAVPTQSRAPTYEVLSTIFRIHPDAIDILVNILGYAPLGVALVSNGWRRGLLLAAAVSAFAETAQIFYVGRIPGVVDVASNVCGAALGLLIATRWKLPARIAVDRRTAWVGAAVVFAYVLSGASVTVESILNWLGGWLETSSSTADDRADGGLAAHWSFDAIDRGITGDSSGHDLTGAVENGATQSTGVVGSAIELNGKQWVDFGNPRSLRLTHSMTLSAWVKATSFPSDDASIISTLSRREIGYQLDLTADQGPRTIGFKISDGPRRPMIRYGRTPLVTGRWYHVAGVYDASARTMDVYLNGRHDNGCLIGEIADHQQPSRERVFVGKRAGGPGFEFIGAIDEVQIDSKPETASDIQAAVARWYPQLQSDPQANDEGGVAQGSELLCAQDVDTPPPRIAGPLISLGAAVALVACALCPVEWFEVSALAMALLIGSTAPLWMAQGGIAVPVWLPALYTVSGALLVLLAGHSARSQKE